MSTSSKCPLNLRDVRLSDAADITAIYNHYIRLTDISFETEELTVADMAKRIEDISSSFPYIVAEVDDMVVAYCYAHLWKERAAYGSTLETTVYVAPDRQRQRLGERLMLRLIDDCRLRGYHALIACITGGNEASILLHEKLGFRRASCFREVGRKFGRLIDVVDYELIL